MRKITLASGLAITASALVLASTVPACGGSSSPPGFGGEPGGSSSGSTSSGSGSGGTSSSGSGSGSGGSIGNLPINSDGGNPQGDPDASCAGFTATATATTQAVAMEFVLDGSGSMGQDNKWTAATAALTSIFTDMGTKNDPGLYAGLIVFSDQNDSTGGGGLFGGGGPYPGTNDVAIGQVNSTQAGLLEARYGNGDQPSNDTPTGAAMTGGYSVLESFTGAGANAKKVLILITDGVPTDNCSISGTNYASNQCVTQAAAELAKASPAGPIETFAIGVGAFPSTSLSNYDPNFLGNIASAGGSGPTGCTPSDNTSAANLCYFEVDPSGSASATETAFENAINAIRGKVVSLSCTFKINAGDAGAIDPGKVNVIVNGKPVAEDPTNGWTYDNPTNPTSVTLHGTSCADVTNATVTASVSVELGCAYKPPPQAQ